MIAGIARRANPRAPPTIPRAGGVVGERQSAARPRAEARRDLPEFDGTDIVDARAARYHGRDIAPARTLSQRRLLACQRADVPQ
jgi:hypothetical protein